MTLAGGATLEMNAALKTTRTIDADFTAHCHHDLP